MPQLLKNLTTFDGNSANAKQWIKSLTSAQLLHDLPDTYMLETARTRLVSGASYWYAVNEPEIQTWQQFVDRFNSTFVPKESFSTKWRKMVARTQHKGEGLSGYFHEKVKLCKELDLDIRELKEQVLIGLWSKQMCDAMFGIKHFSVDQLFHDLQEYSQLESERVSRIVEASHNRSITRGGTIPRRDADGANVQGPRDISRDASRQIPQRNERSATRTEQPTSSTYLPARNSEGKPLCFQCKKYGHTSKYCLQTRPNRSAMPREITRTAANPDATQNNPGLSVNLNVIGEHADDSNFKYFQPAYVNDAQNYENKFIPRCIITLEHGEAAIPVYNLTAYDAKMDANIKLTKGEYCSEQVEQHLEVNTVVIDGAEDMNTDINVNLNIGVKKQQLVNLINQYKDCFATNLTDLGLSDQVECKIETVNDEAVTYRPYRLSASERQKRHIDHVLTTPSTARANGQVERLNRYITPSLASLCKKEDHSDWDQQVNTVQWGINNTHHQATKTTPFRLLFNYEPRDIHGDCIQKILLEHQQEEDIENRRQEALEKIKEDQERQKRRYNAKRSKASVYEPGDLVMIRREASSTGESRKLMEKYKGPYIVTEKLPFDRYRIEDMPETQRTQKFYKSVVAVDCMKRFMAPQSEDDSDEEPEKPVEEKGTEKKRIEKEEKRTKKRPQYLSDYVTTFGDES
nr:unnamed protein product [Callosobruchus analis]